MNIDEVIRYTSQAMMVCLIVSLPSVVASAVIGLGVAFLQAVTSLQDQSIAYAVKLLGVGAVLAATAVWSGSQLVSFSRALFEASFRP